jgi:hypothetical protein
MSNFDELQNIANGLLGKYPEDQAWNGSSFNWMRRLPPGSKHVVGRSMLAVLLNQNGMTATFHKSQIRVNGNGISVKVALMWQDGIIKFQNIRDTNFDHLFCFALYPQKAFGWLIPKNELWVGAKVNKAHHPSVTSQHRGADCWVHIDPADPKPWLKAYGGTIDQAMAVAKKSL